jgi:hypothetical protein
MSAERNPEIKESFIGHLARFFSGKHETKKKVKALLRRDPNLSRADVFRELTSGLGKPPTHRSGKREGEIKKGRYVLKKRKN